MALFLVPTSLFCGSTKAYSFQRNLETIWYGGKGDIFSLRQVLSRNTEAAPVRVGGGFETVAPSYCEEGKGQVAHAHFSQGASSFVSGSQ